MLGFRRSPNLTHSVGIHDRYPQTDDEIRPRRYPIYSDEPDGNHRNVRERIVARRQVSGSRQTPFSVPKSCQQICARDIDDQRADCCD